MSDGAIVAKRSGETRSDGASCIFATREGAVPRGTAKRLAEISYGVPAESIFGGV